MVRVTISSSSTEKIRNTFLNLLKQEVIIPTNINKVYCRFNIHTLDDNVFEIFDKTGIIYSFNRFALGYNGTGPNDFLICLRASGFSKEILPDYWITTHEKILADNQTIELEVTK